MAVNSLVSWSTLAILALFAPVQTRTDAQDTPDSGIAETPATYLHEMKFLDRDHDRRINERELATGQQMAAMLLMLSWDECDRDHDGNISRDELEQAAATAMQALLEEQSQADAETEQQAEQDLAQAVPLELILDRLAADQSYAAEVAALREAVKDLDDEDVVTYVFDHAKRYPHLAPVVRTWVRHYPVRPALRRYVKPHPYWRHRPAVKPEVRKPVVKPGKPGPRKAPPRAVKPKPKPRPAPKPRRGRP